MEAAGQLAARQTALDSRVDVLLAQGNVTIETTVTARVAGVTHLFHLQQQRVAIAVVFD